MDGAYCSAALLTPLLAVGFLWVWSVLSCLVYYRAINAKCARDEEAHTLVLGLGLV
jgi:hypothetical protein